MNISASIRKLASLFILLFVALSGSLVYWQVVVARDVTDIDFNLRTCMKENAPIRGRILDRNGVVLAESKTDTEGACGYQRVYHEASLAGLIGHYAGPNYAITGLEKEFDDYLTGRIESVSLDNTLNRVLHRPPVGYDIYLTIDVRIQRIVDQHFDTPTPVGQQKRGAVVVSDPNTGEILAMLSRPKYDPNKLVNTLAEDDLSYYQELENDPDKPLVFRPLWGNYVPGSTYKAITLMAALEHNAVSLNTKYNEKESKGPVQVGVETFNVGDNLPRDQNGNHLRKAFPITAEYAFAISDNIVFAQMGGNAVGPERWLEFNQRFYVGEQIPFDLPSATSRVLPEGKTELEVHQTAENSFGQGTNFVTPFQMSLFDNAVANDGVLMRPMLVKKITNNNKQDIQVNDPQVLKQAMNRQAAIDMRRAMYGVLFCGTGDFGRDHFWSNGDSAVIGKTGTAEIDGIVAPHGWLFTQAPYDRNNPAKKPALSIIAMKENSGGGASTNAPMLEKIYNDIFSQNLVKAEVPSLPQDYNYCIKNDLYAH